MTVRNDKATSLPCHDPQDYFLGTLDLAMDQSGLDEPEVLALWLCSRGWQANSMTYFF